MLMNARGSVSGGSNAGTGKHNQSFYIGPTSKGPPKQTTLNASQRVNVPGQVDDAVTKKFKPQSFRTSISPGFDDRPTANVFTALEMKNKKSESPWLKLLRFAFRPDGTFHMVWDVILLLLVVGTSFWEPYKTAFLPTGEMSSLEIILDVLFYFDILINFWTGFEKGFDVVMDKKAIAINYATGWFWLDVLSTVQFDLIAMSRSGVNEKSMRLLRLLKILRLARVSRLLHRLTCAWTVHTTYIEGLKFMLYVFLAAHFMACFFWMLNDYVIGCDFYYKLPQADQICTEWREHYNLMELHPMWQYSESFYWAITTMTTIGYGDRAPQNQAEIIFVIFAEIFGISLFALLLTQINNLNDVLGKEEAHANEVKNTLVSFMKGHKINNSLIQKVIHYLNFKSHSHSGSFFYEDDKRFMSLSDPLRKTIRESMYTPVLEKTKLWGWSKEDVDEDANIRRMFAEIDEDGGGTLDRNEIENLVKGLGLNLKAADLDRAIAEMDVDKTGDIAFPQFHSWWHIKRYSTPKIPKCPYALLQAMASAMTISAFAPGDIVVEEGWYGIEFLTVLSGSVAFFKKYENGAPVRRYTLIKGKSPRDLDSSGPGPSLYKTISADSREPIVGLAAALPNSWWKQIRIKMAGWEVRATNYCDVAALPREKMIEFLGDFWTTGQQHLLRLARYLYKPILKKLKNGMELMGSPGARPHLRMAPSPETPNDALARTSEWLPTPEESRGAAGDPSMSPSNRASTQASRRYVGLEESRGSPRKAERRHTTDLPGSPTRAEHQHTTDLPARLQRPGSVPPSTASAARSGSAPRSGGSLARSGGGLDADLLAVRVSEMVAASLSKAVATAVLPLQKELDALHTRVEGVSAMMEHELPKIHKFMGNLHKNNTKELQTVQTETHGYLISPIITITTTTTTTTSSILQTHSQMPP